MEKEPLVENGGSANNIERKFTTVEIGAGDLPIVYNFSERAKNFKEDASKRYIGIDFKKEELKKAQERKGLLAGATDRTLFLVANGGRLPIADKTVDEIVLHNVVGDPTGSLGPGFRMFKEIARVLTETGTMKIIENYTPDVAREWMERNRALLEENFKLVSTLTSKDVQDNPTITEEDLEHIKKDFATKDNYRSFIAVYEKL